MLNKQIAGFTVSLCVWGHHRRVNKHLSLPGTEGLWVHTIFCFKPGLSYFSDCGILVLKSGRF